MFTWFVMSPTHTRSFLANSLGVPINVVKKQLIRIMTYGSPSSKLPFSWALAVELMTATMVVLETP